MLSKHIHVRYFLTADKVERKELKILFCPTDEMTADFITKPLQGSKFVPFRNQLQGISIDDYDSYRHYYKRIMIGYKLFNDQENDMFPEAWTACRSVLEIKGINSFGANGPVEGR